MRRLVAFLVCTLFVSCQSPSISVCSWNLKDFGNSKSEAEIAYNRLSKAVLEVHWKSLTREEIDIAFDDTQEGGGFDDFAYAIESTLRRKNHET